MLQKLGDSTWPAAILRNKHVSQAAVQMRPRAVDHDQFWPGGIYQMVRLLDAPVNGSYAQTNREEGISPAIRDRAQFRCLRAHSRERPVMAASAGSERQLKGASDQASGFLAVSCSDQLSSIDPERASHYAAVLPEGSLSE